jgi:hypothetical protein
MGDSGVELGDVIALGALGKRCSGHRDLLVVEAFSSNEVLKRLGAAPFSLRYRSPAVLALAGRLLLAAVARFAVRCRFFLRLLLLQTSATPTQELGCQAESDNNETTVVCPDETIVDG